jgi:hypothetical protein
VVCDLGNESPLIVDCRVEDCSFQQFVVLQVPEDEPLGVLDDRAGISGVAHAVVFGDFDQVPPRIEEEV